MLALLSKLRGSSGSTGAVINTTEGESKVSDSLLSENEIDYEFRRTLLQSAIEVDVQMSKSDDLLQNPPRYTNEDERVIREALKQYEAEVVGMERRLLELQAAHVQDTREGDGLFAFIDRMISLDAPSTPDSRMVGSEVGNRFATPLRKNLLTTPQSGIKSRGIDFDAFPHTPTLEQLGISRAVLDLVGERSRVPSKGLQALQNSIVGTSEADYDFRNRPSMGASSGSISSNQCSLSFDFFSYHLLNPSVCSTKNDHA